MSLSAASDGVDTASRIIAVKSFAFITVPVLPLIFVIYPSVGLAFCQIQSSHATGAKPVRRQFGPSSFNHQQIDQGHALRLIRGLGQQFPIAVEIETRIRLTHAYAPAQLCRPIVSQPTLGRKAPDAQSQQNSWTALTGRGRANRRCDGTAPTIKSVIRSA
jgi:hypothetical protein